MKELLKQINKIEREQQRRRTSPLARYNKGKVHVKQMAFHLCTKRNRWVFGGNRSGKTECGAVETVWLARGIHPYRRNKPNVSAWVVSLSQVVQREVAQQKVLYYLDPTWIEDVVMLTGSKGSPAHGVIDYILVKNVFGGVSKIAFKSCEAGREKFQGASLDFVWFDEEPPKDVYDECKMRVLDRQGHIFGTMTPLKGLSWVYDEIYLNVHNSKQVWHIFMEWADNPYLSADEVNEMTSSMSQEMLESLDLPRLQYALKTEAELMTEASGKAQASYLSSIRSLETRRATKLTSIEKRRQEATEKARSEQVKYLADYTKETNALRQKLVDNGMLFSSVIDRMKLRLQVEYEQKVTESNNAVEQKEAMLAEELERADEAYYNELGAIENERTAKINDEYNKLVKSEQNKQMSVDKYNAQLDEKEKKYLMARAKALDNARQAEYNRSFAAKKLYQQMGATGYEQAMLWEKYNVLTSHFANFTKREEAMAIINADSFVQTHLQQYYNTFIDWVNRNVPA